MNGLKQQQQQQQPLEPDYSEFVEVDPTGRYGRYSEVLGKGASKTVYRAFDEYEGIEVAWNQVKLYDFLQSPEDLERLYCEIHLLKTLKHKNIMKFYTSWVDTGKRNINFVTEMFTSGTLRQYRERHKRVNIRAVKQWCRQILNGLLYLHSHDPPVIHRDLKCDNIFVNGNQGEVKIGDLGLAAILRKSHAAHCVGTPEFMAPEVYKEEYNELVDIYSFGMCILEMVTFEYPYSECTHPAQIYKKVISGKKPDALYKVKDPEVRQFVEKCLAAASRRLPARELLKDPFLQIDDGGIDLRPLDYPREYNDYDMSHLLGQPLFEHQRSNNSLTNGYSNDYDLDLDYCTETDNGWGYQLSAETENNGIELFTYHEDDHTPNVDITIKGRRRDDDGIFLRLRIADKEGRIRNIYFPFDIETDTALSVATEMVGELDITDQDVTKIADMIDGEIASLVPDWRSGPGIDETPRYAGGNICENCASTRTSNGSLLEYLTLNNHDPSTLQVLQCINGCAAMHHGRFEEITYQVDGPEHNVNEVSPVVSGQLDDVQNADVWSHQEGPELSSLGSRETHSDEEHERLDQSTSQKDESMVENQTVDSPIYIEPKARNSVHCRRPSYTFLDEHETEVSQKLRWLKARYRLELGDLKDRELGGKTQGSTISQGSIDNWEHPGESSLSSTPPQGAFSKKNFSFNFFSHSRRHSENPTATASSSPENIFTAKSYYDGGGLLPNSLHRTTSLPVDAVD